MFSYNKFKEIRPEDTVQTIKQILERIGLKTAVEWTGCGLEGTYSNRVTLFPTATGANGKGTSESYALASGYAELIERIENGILIISTDPNNQEKYGFQHYPDEKFLTIEELIEQHDPLTKHIFSRLLLFSENAKRHFLSDPIWHWAGNESISCVPFAAPRENRVVYLPSDIYMSIYGSNGMSAGNTMEEALVQGISEILERYTQRAIIDGIVPPEIPREYLSKQQINDLIRQIEKDGRYAVRVLDCSLGRGIPATAVVISDLHNGTFGVSFSSHPSFNVSVERAFTEAFQGSNPEQFSSMNKLDSREICQSYNNYPNLMKIGLGTYPVSFLTGEPSYEFKPWDDKALTTNKEMLAHQLHIIHQEGYEVLVRDSSHLGFPAYQVIIPGMSDIIPICYELLREIRTYLRVLQSLEHFPRLNDEEAKRLLLFLRFKESSVMNHDFATVSGIPLTGKEITSEKICAYLHYQRGEMEKAIHYFKQLADIEEQTEGKLFYKCSAEFCRLKTVGASPEEALNALRKYYPVKTAEKIYSLLSEPEEVMKKVFKPLPCFDCENCSYAENNCTYSEKEGITSLVMKALSKSTVSQSVLLKRLREDYYQDTEQVRR